MRYSFVHWASASLHPAQRALSCCPIASQPYKHRRQKVRNRSRLCAQGRCALAQGRLPSTPCAWVAPFRCIVHRTRSTAQCRRPTWWLEAREDRKQQNGKEKEQSVWTVLFFGIRQLPIFPGRRQPSIVGVQGLNFCVRDGNRWNPLA